jgi:hypothetical protein
MSSKNFSKIALVCVIAFHIQGCMPDPNPGGSSLPGGSSIPAPKYKPAPTYTIAAPPSRYGSSGGYRSYSASSLDSPAFDGLDEALAAVTPDEFKQGLDEAFDEMGKDADGPFDKEMAEDCKKTARKAVDDWVASGKKLDKTALEKIMAESITKSLINQALNDPSYMHV